MKMLMRPQKTQVADRYQFVAEQKVWSRDLPLLAGYNTFDITVIGGAGGFGGNSTKDSNNTVWGAGGGGGGGLRVTGPLKDLAPGPTTIIAGARGAAGVDKSVGTKGGTGGTGGTSTAYDWSAFGGKGGGGGDLDWSSGLGGSGFVSDGGDGGGNSLNLGTVGQGGTGNNIDTAPAYTQSTRGDGVVSATPYANTYGGGGGGGGVGRARTNSQNRVTAQNGAIGCYGTGIIGGGGEPNGSKGGPGGGANIGVSSGTPDGYGSYADGNVPDGTVYIRLY